MVVQGIEVLGVVRERLVDVGQEPAVADLHLLVDLLDLEPRLVFFDLRQDGHRRSFRVGFDCWTEPTRAARARPGLGVQFSPGPVIAL